MPRGGVAGAVLGWCVSETAATGALASVFVTGALFSCSSGLTIVVGECWRRLIRCGRAAGGRGGRRCPRKSVEQYMRRGAALLPLPAITLVEAWCRPCRASKMLGSNNSIVVDLCIDCCRAALAFAADRGEGGLA